MEGLEGGELCSYVGEQHFREWNSKCKGHKVGMCWNEQQTARIQGAWWRMIGEMRSDLADCYIEKSL